MDRQTRSRAGREDSGGGHGRRAEPVGRVQPLPTLCSACCPKSRGRTPGARGGAAPQGRRARTRLQPAGGRVAALQGADARRARSRRCSKPRRRPRRGARVALHARRVEGFQRGRRGARAADSREHLEPAAARADAPKHRDMQLQWRAAAGQLRGGARRRRRASTPSRRGVGAHADRGGRVREGRRAGRASVARRRARARRVAAARPSAVQLRACRSPPHTRSSTPARVVRDGRVAVARLNELLDAAGRSTASGRILSRRASFGRSTATLWNEMVNQLRGGARALAPADFERASAAAKSFRRADVRATAELQLAQRVLGTLSRTPSDAPPDPWASPSGGIREGAGLRAGSEGGKVTSADDDEVRAALAHAADERGVGVGSRRRERSSSARSSATEMRRPPAVCGSKRSEPSSRPTPSLRANVFADVAAVRLVAARQHPGGGQLERAGDKGTLAASISR
jgi:hypothetical protein